MSRGFGATLGAGDGDVIQLTLVTRPTLMSFAWWSYRQGDSGSTVGWRYLFDIDATFGSLQLGGTNGGGVEFFNAPHNSAANLGQWTWAQPTVQVGTWACVTYDSTNVANDPIVYLNGAPVSITESSTPVGAFDATAVTERDLGNRQAGERVFNGALAEFAQWNRILTASEVAALAKGYSPAHFPVGLLDYAPLVRTLWTKRGVATAAGTLVQVHPRTILPRPPLTRAVKLTAPAAPTRRSLTLLGVS